MLALRRIVGPMLLATSLLAERPAAAESVSKAVTIESGTIEGLVAGDILSFKGIPYASPPVEDLRWRPPQPVTAWTGTGKATAFGSDCQQMKSHTEAKGSEDCLFLNVWRPAERSSPDERLPVMVWIHGGGNVIGGSSDKVLDGSALAGQRLVVVSLNYRLGRLGYFAHPALISEAEKERRIYSGNFGLMDQIQALEWVKSNIAKFGGDSGRVTVAGESAGGFSVMHLLTSPITTGLFHRAVVMSGGGRHSQLLRPMRDADPNAGGLPRWPQFDSASVQLMDFTLFDGAKLGPEPRRGVALVEKVARCP